MIHYQDDTITLHHGDCVAVLGTLADNSIDAIVTDPPYGLEFMGKEWDAPWKAEGAHWRAASRLPGSHSTNPTPRPQNFGTAGLPFQLWCQQWATECLRVLKPGGHMLAAGGSRTFHRLVSGVEDAGFEIRDTITWHFASGFPKSLDVSKAIDKAAGAERAVIGSKLGLPGYSLAPSKGSGHLHFGGFGGDGDPEKESQITAPATDAAREWQGWGTALKPATEFFTLARKPLAKGHTVAANVLAHGTGAINVDGCRIGTSDPLARASGGWQPDGYVGGTAQDYDSRGKAVEGGRWPANVALDTDMAAVLDAQSGTSRSPNPSASGNYGRHEDTGGNVILGRGLASATPNQPPYGDTGGASRYFFVAQPDEESEWHGGGSTRAASTSAGKRTESKSDNLHTGGSGNRPTVQSPTDTKSTTGITTHSTTASTTSCASLPNGTTTTTSDYASDTAGSTDRSSDSASDAPDGSCSTITTSDVPEHGRDTASPVSAQRTVNGSQPIASTSTHHSEHGEQLEARFKFTAKAPSTERPNVDGEAHATVKPLDLMRWLIRLITPPGGVVLDPFAGSGTTLEAAGLEGFRAVGIEREADYLPLIVHRIQRTPIALFDDGEAS